METFSLVVGVRLCISNPSQISKRQESCGLGCHFLYDYILSNYCPIIQLSHTFLCIYIGVTWVNERERER